jgi:hypothetical protein
VTQRERVIRWAITRLGMIDRETAKEVAKDLRSLLPRRVLKAKPSKVARAERKAASRDEDAGVRGAVMTRAMGRCECCGSPEALEVDHFFGRARDRSVTGCWGLCSQCHRDKTDNRPSRKWWLGRFQRHALFYGYGTKAEGVNALIAKDEGKHPPRIEEAKP